MTTVILIRHAHSIANEKGVLAGRTLGIGLSKRGLEQAESLKQRLGSLKINNLRISPLERCELTIAPWVNQYGISQNLIDVDPDVSEVDYGKWTGKKLSILALKKEWRVVQKTPSQMIFPEGESLLDVQRRAENALLKSAKQARSGVAVIVSHGDVIKSLVATALKLDLDNFQKIVIDPASVTVLDFSKNEFRLLHLNDVSTNFEYLTKKSRPKGVLIGGGAGRT